MLAAEVSLLVAMLGSLEEAQDVLAARGVALATKTIRTIAYRYAARARLVQQVERTVWSCPFSMRVNTRGLSSDRHKSKKA